MAFIARSEPMYVLSFSSLVEIISSISDTLLGHSKTSSTSKIGSGLILRLLQTVSSILTCAAIVFNFRAVKCFEDLECPNNTYGQNCSQLCSVGCAGPFDACTDGICLFGCDDGFEGPKCEKSKDKTL
ncbi:hypothetical protein RRG08_009284 [Elysia crispata]|uniref:Uncharacterized protein n=1 Tax=Elysia crispata TaxID=231223 RepID=A0AAE0YG05_9GAST|nr:hypothetical protein RRG08_009284 [Elysia crispata]